MGPEEVDPADPRRRQLAGTVARAPAWMREHGLEWLHRLASEPGRLWKRYLVTNTVRDGLVETGRWRPDALPAGDYVIRASVRDYSGNEGVGARDLKITLL